MKTFVNLSNHPSCSWPAEQLQEAEKIGHVIDLPFPAIPSRISDRQLDQLVEDYRKKVLSLDEPTVMLQGEFVFTYRLVSRLLKDGIPCVCARTERKAIETVNPDGSVVKQSIFRFAGFHPYLSTEHSQKNP